MCRPVGCSKCGKTTWAGCGAHVDQVMSRVRPEDRCACDRSAKATASAPGSGGSVWDAIKSALGR